MSCLPRIARSSRFLKASHLQDLFDNRIAAIVISNFYPKESCALVAPRLNQMVVEKYPGPYSVKRFPMSFAEVHLSRKNRENYYHNGSAQLEKLRRVFPEGVTPIDDFKDQVNNVWKAGAQVAQFSPHYGEKMTSGLVRIVPPGSEGLVHRDLLTDEITASYLSKDLYERTKRLQVQFAANVYLQMPPEGGELELWCQKMPKQEFYKLAEGKYGIVKEKLNPPKVIYKPKIRECIVFRADHLHRVAGSVGGKRITISTFGAKFDDNNPLVLWS